VLEFDRIKEKNMAEVTFVGAVGTVTGSCTYLKWGETRILVDCGMFQGGEEVKQMNWNPLPVDPSQLTAVVITHAHLDHTGLLPRLTALGFDGPIYCTNAARGLISLILQDAGHLQEEQARYARKNGHSRYARPKPLYTSKDARKALKLLRKVPFDDLRELVPGVRVRFRRAGHLLGAASVEIEAKGGDGKRRTWCFSGDVGRFGVPILKDPEPPINKPYAVVLESTYGDRLHAPTDPEGEFRKVIRRVYGRGGKVIIPSFALGRMQEVLYHLSELVKDGDIDPKDVFLDSPMAIKATDLYAQAKKEHDDELVELIEQQLNPLSPDLFNRCRSGEQSRALNRRRKPAIIVASSGMATGGRVVHHLKHNLAKRANAVVFVGYQASGTRGRALVEGAPMVAIHGDNIPVRAEIMNLHGLSAHADQKELLRWARKLPAPPKKVFLNHGEDSARKSLSVALRGIGWPQPELPIPGSKFRW